MQSFRKIEDKKEWKELLGRALFKTFFHELEWEEFLEREFKWLKFERFLYKEDVLISFAKYKIRGKERLVSHPFCEYGGPLPLKSSIDGSQFKKDLFNEFRSSFKIKIHPMLTSYFIGFGLKEPHSVIDTYLIDSISTKSQEEVFASFRKTLRHSIKKSESHTIEIKECETEAELADFYGLYLKTCKKNKTIAYPLSFFKYFLNSDYSNIVLAKKDKKVIAGSIFLYYDGYIHYYLNTSDKRHRYLRTNYLILWTKIRNSLLNKYKIFDLGGTGRGSNLEVFKTGWGAKRYPVFELKNYQSDGFKKSKLRNLYSLLPISLVKKISPSLLKYKL
jgi:hypothetical protein